MKGIPSPCLAPCHPFGPISNYGPLPMPCCIKVGTIICSSLLFCRHKPLACWTILISLLALYNDYLYDIIFIYLFYLCECNGTEPEKKKNKHNYYNVLINKTCQWKFQDFFLGWNLKKGKIKLIVTYVRNVFILFI